MFRAIFVLLCALGVLCTGCANADPSSQSPDFGFPGSVEQSYVDDVSEQFQDHDSDDVYVTHIQTGTNEYIILAGTILDASAGEAWSQLRDFEQLAEIALPGLVSDFEWLNGGGPEQIPSTFQFVTGGTTVVEEIYYRNDSAYTLRYRLVDPALGIQEYDAQISLIPLSQDKALYFLFREVTVDPGVIGGLVDLTEIETLNINNYFEDP
jgi:hypothetical protein